MMPRMTGVGHWILATLVLYNLVTCVWNGVTPKEPDIGPICFDPETKKNKKGKGKKNPIERKVYGSRRTNFHTQVLWLLIGSCHLDVHVLCIYITLQITLDLKGYIWDYVLCLIYKGWLLAIRTPYKLCICIYGWIRCWSKCLLLLRGSDPCAAPGEILLASAPETKERDEKCVWCALCID
jgi:hypothetical protein